MTININITRLTNSINIVPIEGKITEDQKDKIVKSLEAIITKVIESCQENPQSFSGTATENLDDSDLNRSLNVIQEFKGTKGIWKHSKIVNEKIEGVDSSKILGAGYGKVIGRVNATHKEEGYANLKLITNAPVMLCAMNDLVIELDKLNYLLPRENEVGGSLIWDRIQTCRSLIKNVLI